MAQRVIMPKQGLQMTEGTITDWIIKEGGEVKEGTPLFEMETDKVTIIIDAPASGKLLKIVCPEGETVPITELIAIIGEDGEDFSALLEDDKKENEDLPIVEEPKEKVSSKKAVQMGSTIANSGRVFISPRAKMVATKNDIDYSKVPGSGPNGYVIERDIKNYLDSAPKATPLAKKVASLNDVDLSDVQGTGARDKILKDDIMKLVEARLIGKGKQEDTVIPFTGMRKVIADRMVDSLSVAAQATHRIKVDMSEAAKVRDAFKKADKKVSYNDIISYSVCKALTDYPIMNSEITPEGIVLKNDVNLGIAVAIENGLIVPVLNHADLMTIEEIGIVTRELADKAKSGQLKPNEYKGGSFTISNLGMFGLDSFTAIINQPESGILAVGRIEKIPVVIEDEIVIRPMMVLTLTYDHRVVDGAPAAQFLARIKQYLEEPYLLL